MLTRREWTVLALVCDGQCVKEAGAATGVTHHTARNHLTNVYRKLITAGEIDGTKQHRKTLACVWFYREGRIPCRTVTAGD